MRKTLWLGSVLACLGMTAARPAQADPVRIYAAGSLSAAMTQIIAASGLPAGAVTPVFGPAGLLRERLESGEAADLFASADMAQPRRLQADGKLLMIVPFARNRLCVVARPAAGITADNLLDRLLSPQFRLATSTPVADPGGDYTWAVFDRADALRPGAGAILKAKALQLLGGPTTMVPVAGKSPAASIFLADRADALMYYCSGAPGTQREVPELTVTPLPPSLEVGPVYGLGVMTLNPDALRLALFILSAKGQEILAENAFLPVLDKR